VQSVARSYVLAHIVKRKEINGFVISQVDYSILLNEKMSGQRAGVKIIERLFVWRV
jgi:hypothetical protein